MSDQELQQVLDRVRGLSIRDLVDVYKGFRHLPASLDEVATEHVGLSRHHFYRKVKSLEDRLGQKLVERHAGGTKSKLTAAGEGFMRRMEALVTLFAEPADFPIRIAAPHVLCTKFGPRLHQQSAPPWLRDPNTRSHWIDRPCDQLLRPISFDSNFDLLLTFGPENFPFGDRAQTVSRKLKRALYVPNNHRAYQSAFTWDTLAGMTMILPSDEQSLPDLPFEKIRRIPSLTEVRVDDLSTAHSHVMASHNSFSFTYPWLLREHEEKMGEAVQDEEFGEATLYLVRVRRSHDERSEERERRIDELFSYLAGQIQELDKGLPQFARSLANFTKAWHTSDAIFGGGWVWVPGDIRLHLTPGGYVKGWHHPSGFPRYDIFGRYLYTQADELVQFLWRGTYLDSEGGHELSEHYAASVLTNLHQLEKGPILATTVGRRTLLHHGGPIQPAPNIGVMVIDTARKEISNSAVTPDDLNAFLREHAQHVLNGWKPPTKIA